jgi:hypothetical protein
MVEDVARADVAPLLEFLLCSRVAAARLADADPPFFFAT